MSVMHINSFMEENKVLLKFHLRGLKDETI